jgi:hypothetical protein
MNKCIYLSIRAVSLSDAHTHTHTHSLWLSCQQFVFACACVSLYGPHFECFSDTCRLFDSKLLCPVPLCVCVCVCVCIRQRHHSYVHERETHTVTDSDREGDTFTHIHTFFHSLSLSLSLSIYLSLSLVSILLDLSRSLLCDRKVERTMSHARSLRRDHSPNRHFARERDSQNFSKETHTPLVLDGRLQEPCDLNYQTIHHQVPVFEIGFLSTLLIAFWKTL